jgi:GTPase
MKKCVVVDPSIYQISNSPIGELTNLLSSLDIEIDYTFTQQLSKPHSSTYVGRGFLYQVKTYIDNADIKLVCFNNDLTPLQISNISQILDCEVYDRSMVILKIFALRANSKEAKLQVEVAYLKYMANRLIDSNKNYSQVTSGGAGGVTNRGSGEKEINIKRYLIKKQIKDKEDELQKMVLLRKNQRKERKSSLPVVAIVGYTNAGKSTLMNNFIRLGENDKKQKILEENRLFATLSTTTRYIKMKNHYPFLLTDTVGFISSLPTPLIKAFRSTLEEIKEADLLIHVVDCSTGHVYEDCKVTMDTLKEIGVDNKKMIYLYNKVDLRDTPFIPFVDEDELIVSLKDDSYMEDIASLIDSYLEDFYFEVSLLIPFENSSDFYKIQNEEAIVEIKQNDLGYDIVAKIAKSNYKYYSKYLKLKQELLK